MTEKMITVSTEIEPGAPKLGHGGILPYFAGNDLWLDGKYWRDGCLPKDGDTIVFPKTGLPYIKAAECENGQNTESQGR